MTSSRHELISKIKCNYREGYIGNCADMFPSFVDEWFDDLIVNLPDEVLASWLESQEAEKVTEFQNLGNIISKVTGNDADKTPPT